MPIYGSKCQIPKVLKIMNFLISQKLALNDSANDQSVTYDKMQPMGLIHDQMAFKPL